MNTAQPGGHGTRHLPIVYVIAAIEFVAGALSFLAAFVIARSMLGSLRPPGTDDWVALFAMAVAGLGLPVSGVVTLFHSSVPYSRLRRMRLLALAAESLMIAGGAGILAIAKQRGGDWAGIGLLGGMLLAGLGAFLAFLSVLALRVVRRLRVTEFIQP